MANSYYQKKTDPPIMELRSKKKKGIVLRVYRHSKRNVDAANSLPQMYHRSAFDVCYFDKNEQQWKRKGSLYLDELVEVAKLAIHAIRWICAEERIPAPFAFPTSEFDQTEFSVKDSRIPEDIVMDSLRGQMDDSARRREKESLNAEEPDDDFDINF